MLALAILRPGPEHVDSANLAHSSHRSRLKNGTPHPLPSKVGMRLQVFAFMA